MSSDLQTAFQQLREALAQCIYGQEILIERLLIALLADGHLLVEGAPGLAKTTAVKSLATRLEGDFHRIQFTPDLLPADLTGTDIYRPQQGEFVFQQGPLFHHIILADEINRAPAKVQSALLEAMEERQITVGQQTYPLPRLFLVMATQNPLEQEGTYPLPEAQLDRFLLHVRIGYPDAEAEKQILHLARARAVDQQSAAMSIPSDAKALVQLPPPTLLSQSAVFAARQAILTVHFAPVLEEYLVQLARASRQPSLYGQDWASWLTAGFSPRGTIALERCARARAWLLGRDYVSPDDIQAVAPDVLRHRLILSYAAEADGIDADTVLTELLKRVPVP